MPTDRELPFEYEDLTTQGGFEREARAEAVLFKMGNIDVLKLSMAASKTVITVDLEGRLASGGEEPGSLTVDELWNYGLQSLLEKEGWIDKDDTALAGWTVNIETKRKDLGSKEWFVSFVLKKNQRSDLKDIASIPPWPDIQSNPYWDSTDKVVRDIYNRINKIINQRERPTIDSVVSDVKDFCARVKIDLKKELVNLGIAQDHVEQLLNNPDKLLEKVPIYDRTKKDSMGHKIFPRSIFELRTLMLLFLPLQKKIEGEISSDDKEIVSQFNLLADDNLDWLNGFERNRFDYP